MNTPESVDAVAEHTATFAPRRGLRANRQRSGRGGIVTGECASGRRIRRGVAVWAVVVAALAVAVGCGSDQNESAATDRAFVTFAAAGETFRVELIRPNLVDHAQRLLAGEAIAAIPVGIIVRSDPRPNEPWSWHIDPATLEFAEATVEVCDGRPSDVESGTITSDRFCPWTAKVVAFEIEA